MSSSAGLSAKNDKRLLIVEDSRDFQALLRHLFSSEGYSVECALNGKEALELLRSGVRLPDLILLDIMMPVMDGFEFRREQERDAKLAGIPIVVMTAHGDAQVCKAKIGAKDFIKKPPDMNDLLDVVRSWC